MKSKNAVILLNLIEKWIAKKARTTFYIIHLFYLRLGYLISFCNFSVFLFFFLHSSYAPVPFDMLLQGTWAMMFVHDFVK